MAKELKVIPYVLSINNASFGKRIFAYIFDVILVSYVFSSSLMLYLSFYLPKALSFSLSGINLAIIVKIVFALTVILFIYFFTFTYLVGATFGTWFFGINIVQNTKSGISDQMEVGNSLLYSIIPSLVFVFPLLVFVDYLLMLFFGKTLSDIITGMSQVEFKVNSDVVVM